VTVKYVEPEPRTRAELEADLNSGDVETIATALLSAALHDECRTYVETRVIRFLQHEEPSVRGVAALAAGHFARIHRQLSTATIVPLIEVLLGDTRTRGKAEDALEDIHIFLGQSV
jgi:hypothetical protein